VHSLEASQVGFSIGLRVNTIEEYSLNDFVSQSLLQT